MITVEVPTVEQYQRRLRGDDEAVADAIEHMNMMQSHRRKESTRGKTGGASSYYKVAVDRPTTKGTQPYIAECNDLIESLGLDFAEGNILKALWRRASARKGQGKEDTSALYDAEKMVFFAKRVLAREQ